MTAARPCAVFDLDGALIDSVPHFVTVLNAMLADRGAPFRVCEAEVKPHATAGGLSMVGALLRGVCGEPEEALLDFRARYAALETPADCLFPRAREALEALSVDGIALAVWSNKSQPLCEKVLGDLGLAPLFGAIVGTGPEVPHKPDPAGLDRALAACGSARGAACFIGDSEADYEGARAAGVSFVLLTHGYGDYTREYPEAVVLASFAQVPAAVRASLFGEEALA